MTVLSVSCIIIIFLGELNKVLLLLFFWKQNQILYTRDCVSTPRYALQNAAIMSDASFNWGNKWPFWACRSIILQTCSTVCWLESPSKPLPYNFYFLQLVATIIHQSHLCPLPLGVQPIIWNFDHCLHLYPTPQTVFINFWGQVHLIWCED